MNFMQRQFQISQQLIQAMTSDAEYQRQIADITRHFESLLLEKNKRIAKLESTIQAMKCLYGPPTAMERALEPLERRKALHAALENAEWAKITLEEET